MKSMKEQEAETLETELQEAQSKTLGGQMDACRHAWKDFLQTCREQLALDFHAACRWVRRWAHYLTAKERRR
jgi:cyclopropane fatty-acyl-phospholipid synthase-like methyltransferase